jgi:NAD(P)-dependent dehydrogenase (short-subunit alcohol dehydrogenase family)
VRCIQAVVGSMRQRGSGCIVNISSVAGLFAAPLQVPYSASKWAVECLSEALAHELAPFGVRVVSIEPGVVKTNIFENAAQQSHFDKGSPYATTMGRVGRIFAAGFRNPLAPGDVAEKIYEAITASEYRLRWPVGSDAEHYYAARTTARAEDWIALGAAPSEDAFGEGFKTLFGIDV